MKEAVSPGDLRILGVIPARYASTRLPGKPLADLGGRSLLQRVYATASESSLLDHLCVATDDDRIEAHCRAHGIPVHITAGTHESGTDRCAEIAALYPGAELVVNIQGDEPFVEAALIDDLCRRLLQDRAVDIVTAACPVLHRTELLDPSKVKVVFDCRRYALYFSRSPIPHARDIQDDPLEAGIWFRHLGIYGFRRATLLEISHMPPGRLERTERLEQLRWLEAGMPIAVEETVYTGFGIDTPEDLEAARKRIRSER